MEGRGWKGKWLKDKSHHGGTEEGGFTNRGPEEGRSMRSADGWRAAIKMHRALAPELLERQGGWRPGLGGLRGRGGKRKTGSYKDERRGAVARAGWMMRLRRSALGL